MTEVTEQLAQPTDQNRPPDDPAPPVKSRLTGPKTINEVADLVNKIVFGFCTIAIALAVFLLNNSIDEGNRRRELYTFLADTPAETVTPAQIRKVGFLKQVCNSYLQRVDDEGARVLCQTFPEPSNATVQAVSKQSAPVAEQLAEDGDVGKYLGSPEAVTQSSLVAATETAIRANQNRWFAVVGTVPDSQRAAANSLANRLATIIPSTILKDRPIRIYRTKISKSFAITVGDAMSKDNAAELAAKLREISDLHDAFAQPDRDWALVPQNS